MASYIIASGVLATSMHHNTLTIVSHASDGLPEGNVCSSSFGPEGDARTGSLRYYGPEEWIEEWDGLPAHSSAGQSAVRHIILIRHGQYYKRSGDANCILTELGRQQATELGVYLGKLSQKLDLPITRVVASTMTRAQETCNIALTNLGLSERPQVISEDLIRECRPVYNDLYDLRQPGQVEKFEQFNARQRDVGINKAFDRYFRRPATNDSTLELYFIHNNVIGYLTLRLLQLPMCSWAHFPFKHCSITHLKILHNGHVVCEALGDTMYMDGNKHSTANVI